MSASKKPDAARLTRRETGFSLILIAALLVAFFAAWPLVGEPGFLNTRGGGDSPFLLQRVQQMETALRDGHFPVRWMRDANYGFGYPFFNYYAPLSIYFASLFRFLGFSLVRSIELAQLAGFLLAGAGVFLLARRWYANEWAALLASVAYTVAPFHLVNVYVRGDSLAEFWAMAWYPWIILAADRLLAANPGRFAYGRAAALALVYAALILSHNISALIFTPFLLLFVALRWFYWDRPSVDSQPQSRLDRSYQSLLATILAGILALALAAWFFLPALVEQRYAQLEPVTSGYFHFANHFRGVDLVQSSTVFDFDVSGGNAFRMGLVQAAAAILGTATLVYTGFRQRTPARGAVLFVLLTILISTFMVTPASRLLWENLPLLPFTQFPWRFLSVQAFAAALAIGALALLPYCRVVSIVTAVILIASSFAGLRTDQLTLSDEDITAGALAGYEWFTGNIGSTVSAEYLPQTVQPRYFNSGWLNNGQRAVAKAVSGSLVSAEQLSLQTGRQQWAIETGEEGAGVVLPTMAWPGWRATIDDLDLAITAAPGSGQIMLDIPPGAHQLTLELGRTRVRLAAELFSLGAIMLVAFMLVKAGRPRRASKHAVVIGVALFFFLLLFRFWPENGPPAGNLNWDFAQMAYLHHDEAGVAFNSGTSLLSYEYDREAVQAGQQLTVTLTFSEANDDVVTTVLGSPALTWPAVAPSPPAIAEQSAVLNSRTVDLQLSIPENAPAGLVAPRLTLATGRPLMPSGRLRGDLFLKPLRIVNDREAAVDEAPLDVKIVDVRPRDERTLDVQLAWITRNHLSQNYSASLLLIDDAGNWLAQLDTQPGYGFLPSSAWAPGTAVDDWLALMLPDSLPWGEPLGLVARLYDVASGDIVLTRRLGDAVWSEDGFLFSESAPSNALPEISEPLTAQFDEQIQLLGYDLQQGADGSWLLTFYWQALKENSEDVLRFVHVFDPGSETIVWQSDGHARQNSYPTSQWTEGEIVADRMVLRIDEPAAGEYRIGAGFYRPGEGEGERLAAYDPQSGESLDGNRVMLPDTIRFDTP